MAFLSEIRSVHPIEHHLKPRCHEKFLSMIPWTELAKPEIIILTVQRVSNMIFALSICGGFFSSGNAYALNIGANGTYFPVCSQKSD